ncbi:hypothetical protein BD289DRAFT_424880 [Coniella lustricola]|uniref:Secreted protein n=1 Tax=Coniella lustricola TaxID=2025994 RepID=A0A2T3AHV9_9PEZI|nr:hypothetical protein BD289DRAFT_424880 [Coniella lustricola]
MLLLRWSWATFVFPPAFSSTRTTLGTLERPRAPHRRSCTQSIHMRPRDPLGLSSPVQTTRRDISPLGVAASERPRALTRLG